MQTKAGHIFSRWAFFLSVGLSPFLVAAASFGLMATKLIPSLTFVLLAPAAMLVLLLVPFIVLGWPALYFASLRRAPSIWFWVVVGVLVGLVSPVAIGIQNALLAGRVDAVLVKTAFEIGYTMGLIVMPIWSGFAALLYWIFTRGQKAPSL
ncbi:MULTISPECIES: hypothetical protein [Falsihalocynthiibacter]|uniref:hypothetical protein n=1 Tax=Falsihalocynthiibacter TaxID=2854182 RepID=UPI0030027FC1